MRFSESDVYDTPVDLCSSFSYEWQGKIEEDNEVLLVSMHFGMTKIGEKTNNCFLFFADD